MTDSERAFAVQYLEQTRDRLLALAKSLTPEQCNFRRSDKDWSVAELIEHIVVVENWALGNVEHALKEGMSDESRRGKGAHKDQLILEGVPARATRVQAPEGFRPAQRWPDFENLLREFVATRSRVIHLARTTEADLRVYFAPHPMLRDLDGYQWLLMIASHSERHVRQAIAQAS